MSDFTTYINIVLEVLKASALKKQKIVKGIQIVKKKVKLSSFSKFSWLCPLYFYINFIISLFISATKGLLGF